VFGFDSAVPHLVQWCADTLLLFACLIAALLVVSDDRLGA